VSSDHVNVDSRTGPKACCASYEGPGVADIHDRQLWADPEPELCQRLVGARAPSGRSSSFG
jgi:hypothetical protein